MRIAQVAPLCESVPPSGYGGTERVVSYLTEELVRRGHDVTLFASRDSRTRARLVSGCPRALRAAGADARASAFYHLAMVDEVLRRAGAFDVLHFHIDPFHLPSAARAPTRSVTTLHGRLDLPSVVDCLPRFGELPYVSISDAQRAPLPRLRWVATIHHGLPRELHSPVASPGGYLAFLGRLSPEKGCEAAVAIARRAGVPLRVAGKLDRDDEPYWRRAVLPAVERGELAYVGEIGGGAKDAFLGGALALLFPIDWPEPFGLVMIEAMACGTPVIAFRRGSVGEVVDDGVTGFVVDDVEGAVQAVERVRSLDRRRVRAGFEARFTVERMTEDYLGVYRDVLEGEHHERALRLVGGAGGRAARPALGPRRP